MEPVSQASQPKPNVAWTPHEAQTSKTMYSGDVRFLFETNRTPNGHRPHQRRNGKGTVNTRPARPSYLSNYLNADGPDGKQIVLNYFEQCNARSHILRPALHFRIGHALYTFDSSIIVDISCWPRWGYDRVFEILQENGAEEAGGDYSSRGKRTFQQKFDSSARLFRTNSRLLAAFCSNSQSE